MLVIPGKGEGPQTYFPSHLSSLDNDGVFGPFSAARLTISLLLKKGFNKKRKGQITSVPLASYNHRYIQTLLNVNVDFRLLGGLCFGYDNDQDTVHKLR